MRILGPSDTPPGRLDPVVTADELAVRYAGQPIDLRRDHVLGLAIDVGTTTIVFQLIDLLTGKAVGRRRAREPAAVRRQRCDDPDLVREGLSGRDAPGRSDAR